MYIKITAGKMIRNNMKNIFTQFSNPMTGVSEWECKGDDFDYHQEVASAAFADMLHDSERNKKFYRALKTTIKNVHKEGRKAHVLDIGTGTGILAMMAARSGADSVVACEAFMPMAKCAKSIIEANGLADKITLIEKRSTDIEVGENKDMPFRANVLVTEILDTELIGEGAISIYNHAHRYLLTKDCILIPSKATIYAQIVQSPLAATWNRAKDLANLDGEILLSTPPEMKKCVGQSAVHDMQISQLPPEQFSLLTKPVAVFEFDFSCRRGIPTDRRKFVELQTLASGSVDMVIFWWSIFLDQKGSINLSCAPYWAHPDFVKFLKETTRDVPLQNVTPWRDHWMQAIYYIPKPFHVLQDQAFVLSVNHDEYSFWFDAWPVTKKNRDVQRHECTCTLHTTFSRTRIGQINNSLRNKAYLKYLENTISDSSVVLTISDGSLLSLAIAKIGAKMVICLQPRYFPKVFLEKYIAHNTIENLKIVESLDQVQEYNEITHVFGEPYFVTSILPWDSFFLGVQIERVQSKLNPNVKICPHSAKIYCLPVEFIDLQKIRSPVGNCEDFDLSIFDKLIEASAEVACAKVEAQPVWEYPCKALGECTEILEVSFNNFRKNIKNVGSIDLKADGTCNGVVLWVDWNLTGDDKGPIVTTGPVKPTVIGEYVQWDMFIRQGVHLFPKPKENVQGNKCIDWGVEIAPLIGCIKFSFDIIENTT